jgi:GNAT superfamily N-acetyltransferase
MKASSALFSPILVCRPALAQDTPAMLEITRTIWDGQDYVPYEWDRWLHDASGCLAVAELSGRVVGLVRLTQFGEQDWWEQGLRVHPDFRGQGIASHLYEYLLATWQRIGSGTLRFTTTSDRAPVHHLAERTGFEHVGEFTAFLAEAITDQSHHFTHITLEQAEGALTFAQHSALWEWQYGLLTWGWEWTTPELKWFLEVVEKGHAWWWKNRQSLILAYIDEDDDDHDHSLAVELLAGPLEFAVEVLLDFRRLAGAEGYKQALWVASLRDELAPVLKQAGYIRSWDNSVYLYARKHAR